MYFPFVSQVGTLSQEEIVRNKSFGDFILKKLPIPKPVTSFLFKNNCEPVKLKFRLNFFSVSHVSVLQSSKLSIYSFHSFPIFGVYFHFTLISILSFLG